MSQFEAKIKATLDLSHINSDLQRIARTPITLQNVRIGNVDMGSLQRQFNNVGRAAGNSMQRGMQQAMGHNAWRSNNVSKYLSDYNKALNSVNTGKLNSDLQGVRANYEKIANSGNNLNTTIQSNINQLHRMADEMRMMDTTGVEGSQRLVSRYREYNSLLATTKNQIAGVSAEMKQFASATQLVTTQNKMTAFLQSGTKAAQKYKTEVRGLLDEIKKLQADGQVRASDLQRISDQFKTYEQAARINGQNSLTFGTKLKNAFGKLANYVGASTMIYGSIRTIKNGINEVVELDNALVDLKKTSNATKQELDDFYYTANDSAKKFGTSTKDIIQGAADWSRLGYNLKDSQTMSEVSSIFKSISPGMSIDMANDGLISVNIIAETYSNVWRTHVLSR